MFILKQFLSSKRQRRALQRMKEEKVHWPHEIDVLDRCLCAFDTQTHDRYSCLFWKTKIKILTKLKYKMFFEQNQVSTFFHKNKCLLKFLIKEIVKNVGHITFWQMINLIALLKEVNDESIICWRCTSYWQFLIWFMCWHLK